MGVARCLTKGLLLLLLSQCSLSDTVPPPPPMPPPLPPSPPHPFHHCHSSLTVEENWDPRGNPGMRPCASTDAELEDFYRESMELDLNNWKPYLPLNRTHIDAFMDRWKWYGWHQQSMVLIKDNKWYYPFHASWNHTQTSASDYQGGITLWVTATQYYFDMFVAQGMKFPDTFFFISDQDAGWCKDMGECPMPALAIAKDSRERLDLLFPFMVGSNHSLYNYPFPLKHTQAFFNGRPNWGGSPKYFKVGDKEERFWSRQYLSQLSLARPDKVMCSLMDNNAAAFPGSRMADREWSMKDHARWRYVMNLDGVTYAFRLARLMHTNSVILKENSRWQEYYYRTLQEGHHYLTIFRDRPDDILDVVAAYENRTRDLEELAFNSQSYAKRYLCPWARMLYFRRLLERYHDLFRQPDGRNAMSEFVNEVVWPIVQARQRGDMGLTYKDMKPYVPGRREVRQQERRARRLLRELG